MQSWVCGCACNRFVAHCNSGRWLGSVAKVFVQSSAAHATAPHHRTPNPTRARGRDLQRTMVGAAGGVIFYVRGRVPFQWRCATSDCGFKTAVLRARWSFVAFPWL